ncbi:MAG: RHS repeat-associated core domain-containing protein [Bryobacteraceae bacterium]
MNVAARGEFTGKERDAKMGLDYFGARYFSAAQGRFTSPDPVMSAPERLRDPQQFNCYAYARNNPLRFLDPTGERLQSSGDVNEFSERGRFVTQQPRQQFKLV